LPLCLAGDCSLREASIFGSIVAKNSIPMPHACAALLKICEMDYSGAVSYFLQVFLKKRYSLPFRVLDAVSNHFARFSMDERKMPVLWHTALLAFVKNYGRDLPQANKVSLLELCRVQHHSQMTTEVIQALSITN
jgi:essential nuclear protein 1